MRSIPGRTAKHRHKCAEEWCIYGLDVTRGAMVRRWPPSITRIAATHTRANEQRLHERRALRVHHVALLFAHHVAIALFPAINERKTLRVGQARFELRFAFLRQTQITRFDLVRPWTRRRTQRPRATR